MDVQVSIIAWFDPPDGSEIKQRVKDELGISSIGIATCKVAAKSPPMNPA